MDHLHSVLNDDNLMKMLLHDNDLFDVKNNQNILMLTIRFIKNSQRFSEPNLMNSKKNVPLEIFSGPFTFFT